MNIISIESKAVPAPAEPRQAGVLAHRGAFDFLSLSMFSNSNTVTIFKTQHVEILGHFEKIAKVVDDKSIAIDDRCLEARNLLTDLARNVTIHFSLEESLLYKRMFTDARSRPIAAQYEREMGNLKASFNDFTKRYATPSKLAVSPRDFLDELSKQEREFSDAFKNEERELYPHHERTSKP